MPTAHALSTFAARDPPVHICSALPASGSIKARLWIHFSPDTIPQERGEIQNSLLSPARPSSLSCPGRAELGKQMGLTMPRGSVALGPDGAASFELNDPSARGAAPSGSRLLARCIAQPEAWQSVDLLRITDFWRNSCPRSRLDCEVRSHVPSPKSASLQTPSYIGLQMGAEPRCFPRYLAQVWPWHPSMEGMKEPGMPQVVLCYLTLQVIFLPKNIFQWKKKIRIKKLCWYLEPHLLFLWGELQE